MFPALTSGVSRGAGEDRDDRRRVPLELVRGDAARAPLVFPFALVREVTREAAGRFGLALRAAEVRAVE